MQHDHSIHTDHTDAIFSFGNWVSQRRNVLRLTQQEVADLAGCSVVLIRKIESDARRPSPQVAERLARALHLAPNDIPAFVRTARAEQSPHRLPPPDHHGISSPTLLLLDMHPRVEGNLPAAVSSFIGRTQAIQELRTLLTRPTTRLLTLTGAGGTGKTHLALAIVRPLVAQFPHGVWFVDLAPIADPTQVSRAILHALGVMDDSRTAPHESLIAWLRHRHLLLLIDNVEHLLDGAPVISDMLRAAPKLQVLTTSRVPLRLQGEQEYLVAPLSLPTHTALPIEQLVRYEAIQLFTERATAIQSSFCLTPANACAVAEICLRLDGLPLAIELAAVRIRVFTPEQLLTRLKADGLRVLNSGPRDLSARQRTMQATIEWSYRLLSHAEQRIFARLAVFIGGCSMEAIGCVCSPDTFGLATHAIVTSLVEHHLVRRLETDPEPRFALFETIREYALLQLRIHGEEHAIRVQHGTFFVELAERLIPECWWPPDAASSAVLDREVDNLRAVLRWSLAAEPDSILSQRTYAEQRTSPIGLGLRLITGTHQYWEIHGGRQEGYHWLETLYPLSHGLPVHLRLSCALALAELRKFSDPRGAQALLETIAPWVVEAADIQFHIQYHCFIGWVAIFCDEPERAITYWNIGLEAARTQDDKRWEAEFVTDLGVAALRLRHWEQSERLLRDGLHISRTIEHHYQIGESLSWLMLLMVEQDNSRQAAAFAYEAVDVAHRIGNRRAESIALEHIGYILLEQGNLIEGMEYLQHALSIARIHNNTRLMEALLYHIGRHAFDSGDLERAEALLHEAALYVQDHVRRPAYYPERQVMAGRIHAARGESTRAIHCYQSSLNASRTYPYPYGVAVVVDLVASLAAQHQDAMQATRFWGAAAALRAAHESAIRPVERFAPTLSGMAEVRTQLTPQEWDSAWDAGHALTWEQAADEALAWLENL